MDLGLWVRLSNDLGTESSTKLVALRPPSIHAWIAWRNHSSRQLPQLRKRVPPCGCNLRARSAAVTASAVNSVRMPRRTPRPTAVHFASSTPSTTHVSHRSLIHLTPNRNLP